MSACGASALSARNTGLFICGLILVVCFSQLAPQVEAKKTLLNTGYERAATAALRTTVTTQRGLLSETTTINCTKVESGSSVHVVCDGEEFFEEEAKDAPGSAAFFRDLFLSIFFVLTAGLMSGLTLGLLGMDVNTLEILKRQGTPTEVLYASRLLPIVRKHHLLLVTLLLCNAGCMEALPLFLDNMMPDYLAIIVSVTAVLFFGEIIPQAILSRWALPIGGKIWWLVWGLMFLTFPIAWPISKLLDWLLGHRSGVYYKRAQLKEFVSYHAASAFGNSDQGLKLEDPEAGGGSTSSGSESDDGGLPKEERLTNDEVMIIKGALDLTSKIVTTSMTPLEAVFSLDEKTVIDARALQAILDAGHSRIPLWRDDPSNFVGMLLVKSLNLNFILEGGIVARADIKELPLVEDTTPLYTMLNIFQTGRSHLAAVLAPGSTNQAIGIITLEDIIEELIQEEIEDEMDLWRREHIRVRKSPSRRSSIEISRSVASISRSKSGQFSVDGRGNGGDGGSFDRPGTLVSIDRSHLSERERERADRERLKREHRREQRRRTRRGRELAMGHETGDDSAVELERGAESDFGPSAPSFSDVETLTSRRNMMTNPGTPNSVSSTASSSMIGIQQHSSSQPSGRATLSTSTSSANATTASSGVVPPATPARTAAQHHHHSSSAPSSPSNEDTEMVQLDI